MGGRLLSGPVLTLSPEEALGILDHVELCYPFEVATKIGPCLLSKGKIDPELAAALLVHEPTFRRKGYSIRQDEKGNWVVALWIRLVYLDDQSSSP